MRLILFALIGVLCLAYCYALAEEEGAQIDLLNVADQGQAHANEGNREARQWGGGWGGRGGWGGGGWGGRGGGWGGGGGGWGGRGGWGGGGWGGRGGWGGGWGR
ncbi:heterogeneous nuclear ribonucleoprotein A1, A2/B1 homolog [Drosophila montana]|uniref:heterogeneous nuclear ribonucleoprotein A1, A2/B1 homolog n=1 Tax=Drosophila montana TaxID=40370 RepID=UPI00313C3A29